MNKETQEPSIYPRCEKCSWVTSIFMMKAKEILWVCPNPACRHQWTTKKKFEQGEDDGLSIYCPQCKNEFSSLWEVHEGIDECPECHATIYIDTEVVMSATINVLIEGPGVEDGREEE